MVEPTLEARSSTERMETMDKRREKYPCSAEYQLAAIRRRIERAIGKEMVERGVSMGHVPLRISLLVEAGIAVFHAEDALYRAEENR